MGSTQTYVSSGGKLNPPLHGGGASPEGLRRPNVRTNSGIRASDHLDMEAYRQSSNPATIPESSLLSLRYVRNFFGENLAQNLLQRAGLVSPQGAPSYVTIVEFWKLCLDNLKLNSDEGHGCTRRRLPALSWGMTFSAVNQMDTVADGLHRFAELVPMISSDVTVKITCAHDRILVNYNIGDVTGSERGDRWLELLALVFHCIIRWGTAQAISPAHIRLSELLDDRDGSMLRCLTQNIERHGLGVTIAYDKSVLSFPLGVRKYQSPRHPETTTFFEIATAATPAASRPSQVIETLRPLLARRALSLQCAADLMGISVATLQRRLASAGTSFRAVSQDIRSEKLMSLLRTNANLDDIAMELGFSDRRSLCRACRQWTGMSPSDYRKSVRKPLLSDTADIEMNWAETSNCSASAHDRNTKIHDAPRFC